MIVAASDRCQFLPSGLSIMIAILQISTSFICSMFFYFICAKQSLFDEFKPRIVKGFECSPMDYPFLVSISMTRKSHFCGGSLLSQYLVLTAGHCCEMEGYRRVSTGLTRARSLVQHAYVAEAFIHPNYSRNPLSTDLCVLRLATPIEENEYTKYVPIINGVIWNDWMSQQSCLSAVAMGFGYQGVKWVNGTPKDPNAPYNPIMQCVMLSAFPPEACSLGLDDTMFCAADPLFEGRDPCQGDSGGPLICQNHQIGIISAGFGCGIEGLTSIYTRVDLFTDYLAKLTLSSCESPTSSVIGYALVIFYLLIILYMK